VDPTRRLPAHMIDQVRAFAEGARTPVEPRNAATVVLMRAGETRDPGSLELYLLRRHVDMAFAAGMAVFPGGGVDPRDFDHEIAWVGPSPSAWAERLGTDEALARALVCAAVRETFEESGVLLAGTTDDSIIEDTTGDDWEQDRRALEARELAFTDFLQRRGLVLRTDLLRIWASWLTPVFEPRRYRTTFFVAELPSGQTTRDVSTESQDVSWLSVREAITVVDQEQMLMLPPQYCTCLELFEFTSPAQVLSVADSRDLGTVEPSAELDDEGAFLTIPERLVALGAQVQEQLRR
jgi:8-oxo-dGTP pyrophosphatase MutT (NUDIX family)